MYNGSITDVDGILVGHEENSEGLTGCTVVICKDGATAGVDVRGSAPGTRETDLLKSEKMIEKIHAVVLSGGSAFGLDASSGVMKSLEDNNIGFDVGVTKVPIVSGAVIFDLNIGNHKIRPDFNMGYSACSKASRDEVRQGNIGCGMGASIGKILGPNYAMKSGLGSASIRVGDLVVGAIVVVNAYGDVYDYESNNILAGAYDRSKKEFINSYKYMKENNNTVGFGIENTTIGVIATNAILTKPEANKVSELGQNGLARSINPIHTNFDGDTLFTMATGRVKKDVNLVGTLASEVVSRAITNGIMASKGYKNIPSYNDII